jgi:hypothetical protein
VIVLAVVLLGLAAPFLIIYGGIGFLLFLPFGSAWHLVKPYWLRLDRERRSRITKSVIWSLSLALWISILINWN